MLGVIYLVFNAGYSRQDSAELVDESIRLASMVADLLPNESEPRGAAGAAAVPELDGSPHGSIAEGVPIPLEEQDSTRLEPRTAQAAAERALQRAARLAAAPGRYLLEAMIAGCFAVDRVDQIDWAEIVALHDALLGVHPSPVGRLNRAIAIGDAAMDWLPACAALDAVAADGGLDGYYLLPAARADLLRRAGRWRTRGPSTSAAAALAPTEGERTFLLRRAEQ